VSASSAELDAAQPVTRAPGGKLDTIQALRALAAIMVTVAHAVEEAKYFFDFQPWFETSPFGKGVDLFFVISGFIIYYASRKLFAASGGIQQFAYNRISRVVPLYFLFTTLMVLVVVFLPGGVKEARFDIEQIWTSYAFIPYERYDGRIAPILSLGWTLNYEMFFYALFALVMWLPARKAAAAAIVLLTVLATIGAFLPPEAPAPLRAWTNNIILEFAFGVMIAVAYDAWGKRFARHTWLAVGLMVIGFFGIYFLSHPQAPINLPRFLAAGVPAALMMVAATLLLPASAELRLPRFMVALGDSSYSLYLSHRFVQRPIQIIVTRLDLGNSMAGVLYVWFAVILAVVAGHVVYLILERPLLRRLKRHRAERSQTAVG